MKRDAVLRLEKHLNMTKKEIEAANAEADRVIGEAVDFALSSEFPAPEEALEDIFA
jgi:TPP-dependent pyruvate/acetoin dehydrogenase alpha subunit